MPISGNMTEGLLIKQCRGRFPHCPVCIFEANCYRANVGIGPYKVFITLYKKWGFDSGDAAFLRLDIYQYNIRTDALDTVPGDHKIVPVPQNAEKPAGARNHNGADLPLRHFDFCIVNKAQPAPVADTNDLFAFEIVKAYGHIQHPFPVCFQSMLWRYGL